MPRRTLPLSDRDCRETKATDKTQRLYDGQGLYLEIAPNGSKYWRFKYLLHKVEKRLAIGLYPQVSLADARKQRDIARKLVAAGKDPVQTRRIEKREQAATASNTFEKVARSWFAIYSKKWTDGTAYRCMNLLETNVFPVIGNRPVAEISTPELLEVIRKVEKREAYETAHRVLQRSNAIFRFAAQTGITDNNPAANLKGALQPLERQHYNFLKQADLPEFFTKLDNNTANLHMVTVAAIRLLMLTFVRTQELRGAKWQEFDFEAGMWTIDSNRMKVKGRPAHKVPLSKQAIGVLKDLLPLTGHREFVFPQENKPRQTMSENTILFALYRMGYHGRATGHGFRSTASTILNENGYNRDHIERQLAHGDDDKIRAAYNHAEYLKERAEMMQWYADHLDTLRGRGQVIQFPPPRIAA
jgi:integrase